MGLFASLDDIQTELKPEPPRIVLYGVQGIGKSSWAASCPKPVVIQTEKGYKEIKIAKWDVAKQLAMVEHRIDALIEDKHDYKTVIIDSLDSLEKLIHIEVVKGWEKPVKSIGHIGFQAGYDAALADWDMILGKLDELQEKRNMMIVLVAHSRIENYNPPDSEGYQRYQLELHKKAAAKIYSWADAVLFLNYKNYTSKVKDAKGEEIALGLGTGERTIYTEERPAYLAKNRYGFPHEIAFPKDLGWSELKKYFAKATPIPVAKGERKKKSTEPEKTETQPEQQSGEQQTAA